MSQIKPHCMYKNLPLIQPRRIFMHKLHTDLQIQLRRKVPKQITSNIANM